MWQSFVDKFFNESGSFIHVLYSMSAERTKQFEIVCAALPRYFYTVFNTDIQNIQITLDGAKENTGPSENKVTCDRAKFIYTYENQCQVRFSASARLRPCTNHITRSFILENLQHSGQAPRRWNGCSLKGQDTNSTSHAMLSSNFSSNHRPIR